jgi:glutamine amidotransferase
MSLTLIVDLSVGNVPSVERSVRAAGGQCVVSGRVDDVERCDRIILPGVGHFDTAMKAIQEAGLVDALTKAAMIDKKPVLGICLGMAMMGEGSDEGSISGLGWLQARSIPLSPSNGHRIPQIGWNSVVETIADPLTADTNGAEFYFLHSYKLLPQNSIRVVAEADYGDPFPAVIAKNNLYGVQFHPEKSHAAGQQIIRNFLALE